MASQLLGGMSHRFLWRVHCPQGSPDPALGSSLPTVIYPFAGARRLRGFRRAMAPLTLTSRLRGLRSACLQAAKRIDREAQIALVHNSMLVAAPPVLGAMATPSLYFCYEYPRHIYEPRTVRRAGPAARLLLAPVRRMERRMDLASARAATRIVTFSGYMAGRIGEIYQRSASLVHPGVDSSFFTPGADGPSDYVLSVGALWPFKGHQLVVRALASLPRQLRPGLRIVADRELPGFGRRLREEAARLGVEIRVDSGLSESQLLSAYRDAAVVACAQVREPYGLVPLEAMACGRPVVAVAEGGFTDNVEDGENGLLVERDPAEMALALRRVLEDRGLARRLGSSGREFVTARRRLDSAADALAVILEETR